MTDSDPHVGARAPQLAEQIVTAVADVRGEDVCECGSLLRDHKYWEDRVYDVNGYRCPKSATGSDYRHSVTQTARHLRDRQIAAARYILTSGVGARAPIDLIEKLEDLLGNVSTMPDASARRWSYAVVNEVIAYLRSGPAQKDAPEPAKP